MPTTCSHVLRYSNNSDLYTAWIKKSKNVFPGKSSSSFNLLSFYHWKKRHFSGYSSVPIHETTSVTTRVLVRFNMATAKWWGIFSKLWPSTASNRSPHLKQDWKLLRFMSQKHVVSFQNLYALVSIRVYRGILAKFGNSLYKWALFKDDFKAISKKKV